jgi:hypothetical protein
MFSHCPSFFPWNLFGSPLLVSFIRALKVIFFIWGFRINFQRKLNMEWRRENLATFGIMKILWTNKIINALKWYKLNKTGQDQLQDCHKDFFNWGLLNTLKRCYDYNNFYNICYNRRVCSSFVENTKKPN